MRYKTFINNQTNKWFLLLFMCLFTRLAACIFYIEDIDSLRFALSLYNYDLTNLQPHFPGYFFYFILIKPIYCIINNIGISFAIMGGIALHGIIYYAYKIERLIFPNYIPRQRYLLGILLFFNPLLFLMSTRYMPDIWGLLLLLMGTFYLLDSIINKKLKSAIFFSIILGFQCGVRLSYIPFWLPSVLLIKIFWRQLPILLIAGFSALLVWLIPLIIDTGFANLYQIGEKHALGHFTEWGGTVMSNNNSYLIRLIAMLESIWADGLGGYWYGRHWLTILWSFALIIFGLNGLKSFILFIKKKIYIKESKLILICIFCFCTYITWAFFFQNIIFKPRHIIPLLPFITFFINVGMNNISNKFNRYVSLSLIVYGLITTVLIIQHKEPTCISQIKEYLTKVPKNKETIITNIGLMNFYFKKHVELNNEKFKFVNIEDFQSKNWTNISTETDIYSTSKLDHKSYVEIDVVKFYHNPYVNRLWSRIFLYQYRKNNKNE